MLWDTGPKIFLGLPLPRLAGDAASGTIPSAVSSTEADVDFLFLETLTFDVPLLFIGSSIDFLGLPLPLFAGEGVEPGAVFKGTVVVVVCSASTLFATLVLASSGSASTVTRILHGLVALSARAVDLMGEDEKRGAGGVVR